MLAFISPGGFKGVCYGRPLPCFPGAAVLLPALSAQDSFSLSFIHMAACSSSVICLFFVSTTLSCERAFSRPSALGYRPSAHRVIGTEVVHVWRCSPGLAVFPSLCIPLSLPNRRCSCHSFVQSRCPSPFFSPFYERRVFLVTFVLLFSLFSRL